MTVPVLHVRPVRGWLNDPNGVVRHRGRWHVVSQHDPLRAQHADVAWAQRRSCPTPDCVAQLPSSGARAERRRAFNRSCCAALRWASSCC